MCTCTINEDEFENRGDGVRGAKMEKVTSERESETKQETSWWLNIERQLSVMNREIERFMWSVLVVLLIDWCVCVCRSCINSWRRWLRTRRLWKSGRGRRSVSWRRPETECSSRPQRSCSKPVRYTHALSSPLFNPTALTFIDSSFYPALGYWSITSMHSRIVRDSELNAECL